MIDFIVDEFEKIVQKALTAYKVMHPGEGEHAIMFSLESESQECYHVVCGNDIIAGKSFKEVLIDAGKINRKVPIDFKGYTVIAPPFIRKNLRGIAEDEGVEYTGIQVLAKEHPEGGIVLSLYNKAKFIKYMWLPELFERIPLEELNS